MIGERRAEKHLPNTTKEAVFGNRLIIDWTDLDGDYRLYNICHFIGYQYKTEEQALVKGWCQYSRPFPTWEEAETWLMEAHE